MPDQRIQQQLKPCVSETVDEQGFEVTCTLYADHDSFHIGLHGVVWADPVSTEGGPPQPRQTGDLEGTLKPCCGDYGRSHYANCPKATPEGRLTPRDETICATCSVPKYEHEFTDPELVSHSFACSEFIPEGTLSTYSICSAHREPDPDCPRCKVTISGGGLSPSDGDCRNGYADDPTSCTFADVCCRTHGHVEGCKGECREDAPERCPHGRYAALGNCVACKVDAPEGRLSPSPGGCPCCGKRPGSLADDCFCNAMRVDRDELRSALRGMVRARVEGEPAYRKAITVLADIAGREEAAKADLQDGL